MRKLWWVVGGLLLAACGDGTRYFRVLFPSGGGASALPDSCYQPQSLPAPANPDEQAAQAYCGIGKKPTATGSASTLVTAQAWTMVDVGANKLYLVISAGGTAPSTGAEGTLSNGSYDFTANQTSFQKQCPGGGGGVVECNGACVNTRSDPANCGSCGFPCAAGQVCRFGNCGPACPSTMQNCGGVQTNTQTDDANCGGCGRACTTAGQICSGGNCVEPCQASCSDRYTATACGTPRQFSRAAQMKVDFKLAGGSLTGTMTSTTSFACTAPGCSADFATRCPSCTTTQDVAGRELTNVTEFEQR